MRFLSAIRRCKPGKPLQLELIESKFLQTNSLRSEEFLRKGIRESFLEEVAFEIGNGRGFFSGWRSGQGKRRGQFYAHVVEHGDA